MGRRWARAGDHGLDARCRGHLRERDARAARGVAAAVLRDAGTSQARGLLCLGARRRFRRRLAPDPGDLRRRPRHLDARRDQDLDHERRDRGPPCRRGVGGPGARYAGTGQFRGAGWNTRAAPGAEVLEARHPRVAHRRGRPRGLRGPGSLPARREGASRRAPCPSPRGSPGTVPGGARNLRGDAPDGRRPGHRHCPSGLRVRPRLREGAPPVRQGDHREPGDRLQARRHARAHRRGTPARPPGRVDGGHGEGVHRR